MKVTICTSLLLLLVISGSYAQFETEVIRNDDEETADDSGPPGCAEVIDIITDSVRYNESICLKDLNLKDLQYNSKTVTEQLNRLFPLIECIYKLAVATEIGQKAQSQCTNDNYLIEKNDEEDCDDLHGVYNFFCTLATISQMCPNLATRRYDGNRLSTLAPWVTGEDE
ncbi:hypothetical protein CHUAL_000303 [Chamberlinius hualienensis]